MPFLIGLGVGLVFGLGLVISRMIDPAVVLGFLDIAGLWNPSLAFVMAGAVAVSFTGFTILKTRAAPVCGGMFAKPPAWPITARLVIGAALFGVGWGLVGVCPGPAITGLTIGGPAIIVFVAAMLIGMIGARFGLERRSSTVATAGRL